MQEFQNMTEKLEEKSLQWKNNEHTLHADILCENAKTEIYFREK